MSLAACGTWCEWLDGYLEGACSYGGILVSEKQYNGRVNSESGKKLLILGIYRRRSAMWRIDEPDSEVSILIGRACC